jgi:hypothetical protein
MTIERGFCTDKSHVAAFRAGLSKGWAGGLPFTAKDRRGLAAGIGSARKSDSSRKLENTLLQRYSRALSLRFRSTFTP